jgi:hypothetical protein
MRLRTAWLLIAAVNVLWAAAFYGYVRRSTTPVVRGGELLRPGASSASTGLVVRVAPSSLTNITTTNAPARPASVTAVAVATNGAPVPAVGRQFGWQDVTNDVYRQYILNLRAVGCPEKQVRNLVVADVNDLFARRRLDQAVRSDSQWWKSDTYNGMIMAQGIVQPANFDLERRELLDKLLGPGWDDGLKLAPLSMPGSVNLAGPVLGALPADTYASVQEVCARSMDRHNSFVMARINNNEGFQPDSTDMAKMRNQTRTDLAKILNPEQLEEFLLRYSHNSSRLRLELRGLELAPEEFRKVFRAVDPIDHQLQIDYGSTAALSAKQREQFDAQRSRAIQEALPPARFEQYLGSKDPLYQQALITATQYGMNTRAVKPIYEMQKSVESRRLQVSQNANLTPEQKAQALQSLTVEQQQGLQKLLGDPAFRQR